MCSDGCAECYITVIAVHDNTGHSSITTHTHTHTPYTLECSELQLHRVKQYGLGQCRVALPSVDTAAARTTAFSRITRLNMNRIYREGDTVETPVVPGVEIDRGIGWGIEREIGRGG